MECRSSPYFATFGFMYSNSLVSTPEQSNVQSTLLYTYGGPGFRGSPQITGASSPGGQLLQHLVE